MGAYFNSLIVQPAVQLLQYMYGLLGSYGIAIIVFGIVVKMVTLPLTIQQLKSSRAMQRIQPLMKQLQEDYKDDKEKLAQEQMNLYREHGVNPLGGCLPLVIQLPVLWGLYRAILNLSQTDPAFGDRFLWLKSLAEPEGMPYILIGLMVVSQFLYQRLMTPPSADPQQESMQKVMQFTPIIFAFVFIKLPAGLVLYYLVFNVVSVAQQLAINKWTDLQSPVLTMATANTSGGGKAKAQGKKTTDDKHRKRRRGS
ncbi:MAG: YidC/Oxa1 family membrane protein insertase [Anaerolineae bacterium]